VPLGNVTPVVEVYDPATDSWTQAANLPTPRFDPASCALNGRIYSVSGAADRNLSTVEVYDLTTDEWQKGPDFPRPRHAHSTICAGSVIYVFGGSAENRGFADVWEYDPNASLSE
jgi:N-acetylneuraminic acid mutarotase